MDVVSNPMNGMGRNPIRQNKGYITFEDLFRGHWVVMEGLRESGGERRADTVGGWSGVVATVSTRVTTSTVERRVPIMV